MLLRVLSPAVGARICLRVFHFPTAFRRLLQDLVLGLQEYIKSAPRECRTIALKRPKIGRKAPRECLGFPPICTGCCANPGVIITARPVLGGRPQNAGRSVFQVTSAEWNFEANGHCDP